jgi:hypothetical protein
MAKEKMVNVDIDIDDVVFLVIAKEAHKQDITFNQMVNKILKKRLDEEDKKK